MRAAPILLAVTAAAALGAAAPAHAGSWTRARAATEAGRAFEPSVAADARGRFAVGFSRELREQGRAEVRQGRLRDRLRGGSVVLDAQRHLLDSVTVALAPSLDGPVVAWRRYADRAQRLRGALLHRDAPPTGEATLTSGPESAYEPRFITGLDGVLRLLYDRRTTSASRAVDPPRAFAAPQPVPSAGVASQPRLAVAGDGSRVGAWLDGGALRTAQGDASGAFGPATAVPTAGYARELQLVQEPDGTVVLAWVANAGAGNAVQIAVRAPGGAFGAPRTVAPAGEGALQPRIAPTSAGELLLTWTASGRRAGYGSAAGTVRLLRLTPAGAAVGAARDLSPSGTRAADPAIVHDGIGSAVVAWARIDGHGRRTIQARRIAPGGIVGVVRGVSPRAGAVGGPVLAGAQGDAVAAWTSPTGKVVYSLYR